MHVRPAAVAGTWYPGSRGALTREVDAYLAAVPDVPPFDVQAAHRAARRASCSRGRSRPTPTRPRRRRLRTMWSALVGPSHFSAFEGVAVFPGRRLRDAARPERRSTRRVSAAVAASPIVNKLAAPHAREHSLEMQLPFLRRVLPDVPIVPMLMGFQRRETILGAGGRPGHRLCGPSRAARRQHGPLTLFRRRDGGLARRAGADARGGPRCGGPARPDRKLSGARARAVRRVRRGTGDRGVDGGAHAGRDRRAHPQVRALR